MPSISQRVRAALKTQLADDTAGFNPNFTTALGNYSVDPSAIDWIGINWNSDSNNFFFGSVAPDIAQGAGNAIVYPFMTIDTIRSQHTNEVVSATFAGPIAPVIYFHLGWNTEDLIPDFASFGDAAEDAMFATVNNLNKQNYGMNILYNGRMSMQRSPIVPGGPGWRQSLSFFPEFKVITI